MTERTASRQGDARMVAGRETADRLEENGLKPAAAAPAAAPGLVWLDPATPIRDCEDRDCGAPDHLV